MSHSPLETDFCNILGRERVCEHFGELFLLFQVSLRSHHILFLLHLLLFYRSLSISSSQFGLNKLGNHREARHPPPRFGY